MKINVLIPFIPVKPGGGLRVMFEYANHLVALGHDVTFYFPIKVSYIMQSGVKMALKYLYYKTTQPKVPEWFELDKKITIRYIYSINNNTIKDGDIVFSTWWVLMFDIKRLSSSKGTPFNLIQDIENWTGNEDAVLKSYTVAKSENVVIANYLYKYIKQVTGVYPHKVSFAIDHNKYYAKVNIAERNPLTICMLYSTEPRKGSIYGLEALRILKKANPELKAYLFSVSLRPESIDDWIEFYYNYSDIPEIYNQSAIFLGPSVQEGCALPPMEALYCGCAVVCTDIDGHKDYGIDRETVLMARPQSAEDLAEKVQYLIDDNLFRIDLATRANKFVNEYTWKRSTKELDEIFKLRVKK
ncbi:glycosyltransferase family 4 protein [Mucilaginibacter sp. PAMB04274]|uniref:glycosyltransferase family 4 protein n=1 Tax=Mucilaginibacter sp. PAMB04274 TaxID=3138568 RepID=UPI0031F710FD